VYACRYMSHHVWERYEGRISGISEFAIFVELDNGVEWTLYLPRADYRINPSLGEVFSTRGTLMGRIGHHLSVQIESVDMSERRIIIKKSEI
jgi:exoribonuclease R